jgi:hypothetical protein
MKLSVSPKIAFCIEILVLQLLQCPQTPCAGGGGLLESKAIGVDISRKLSKTKIEVRVEVERIVAFN